MDLHSDFLDRSKRLDPTPNDLKACLNAHGLYSPFRFVLRLSPETHRRIVDAKQARVAVVGRFGNQAILQASEFLGELGPNAPAAISGEQWRQQLHF
jgi:hypothetical protein